MIRSRSLAYCPLRVRDQCLPFLARPPLFAARFGALFGRISPSVVAAESD